MITTVEKKYIAKHTHSNAQSPHPHDGLPPAAKMHCKSMFRNMFQQMTSHVICSTVSYIILLLILLDCNPDNTYVFCCYTNSPLKHVNHSITVNCLRQTVLVSRTINAKTNTFEPSKLM